MSLTHRYREQAHSYKGIFVSSETGVVPPIPVGAELARDSGGSASLMSLTHRHREQAHSYKGIFVSSEIGVTPPIPQSLWELSLLAIAVCQPV